MVLINVDLPQPLGPRMAMCSPQAMRRVRACSTTFRPRATDTCSNSKNIELEAPGVMMMFLWRRSNLPLGDRRNRCARLGLAGAVLDAECVALAIRPLL